MTLTYNEIISIIRSYDYNKSFTILNECTNNVLELHSASTSRIIISCLGVLRCEIRNML